MSEPTNAKKINPFTGLEEDMPPALISLSPADQRRAAAPPHTEPLPDLIDKAVHARGQSPGVDIETHVGPSMTQDPIPGQTPLPYAAVHETPNTEIAVHLQDEYKTPDQGEEPPNDKLFDSEREVRVGTEVDGVDYPGVDTTEYAKSWDERKRAEAEARTRNADLPEIKLPQPGESQSNGESTDEPQVKSDEGNQGSEPQVEETLEDKTVPELREEARDLGIENRSHMNKADLIDAIEDEDTTEK